MQILIDERAYQQVKNLVEAHEIETLYVKGHTESVRAFEVLQVNGMPSYQVGAL